MIMKNNNLAVTTIITVLVSHLIEECVNLRINNFDVPQSIAKGTAIWLHCNFDLEGDELYSVKWYKNYVEFYRYLPSDKPKSGQTFRLNGIYVDLSLSNATHAFLSATDLDSEGTYACEVSTEGPSFRTLRAERQMKVFVTPKEELRIEGSEPSYSKENLVNLTCIAGASYPSQIVFWKINEQKALSNQLVYYAPETTENDLRTVKLGLVFYVTSNYFHKGILRLQCVSELTLVYKFENHRSLIGGTPKNTSNNGHYTWSKGQISHSSLTDDETPNIEGGEEKYRVGALMDLNCSTKYQEASLKWFLKSVEANESQLVRYPISETSQPTLGLRFRMQNRHFQMQELRLRCIAIHRRIISQTSKTLTIKTYANDDRLQVQPNTENYANASNQVTISVSAIVSYFINSWLLITISIHS